VTLTGLLDLLEGVEPVGDQYKALCTGHSDRRPSLAIRQRGNRILLHCRAGCRTEDSFDRSGSAWPICSSSPARARPLSSGGTRRRPTPRTGRSSPRL
jgi:hypothetical protein